MPDGHRRLIFLEHSPGTLPSMRTPAALAGLVVAAALVAGCSTTSTPSAAPATPSAAPRKAPKGVRGQITAENGASWTVTTLRGRAYTVTISPGTAFGTKVAPATAAQFPVGARVRVAGTVEGTSVSATRVTATPAGVARSSAPATPAAAATTGPTA